MARPPFTLGPFPTTPDSLSAFAAVLARILRTIERAIPRGPRTITLTAATTLPDGLATEHALYRLDASAGAFTVTLPRAIASVDTTFVLKRVSAGAAVGWQCQGADTVDGAASGSLAAQYAVLRLYARAGGYDAL